MLKASILRNGMALVSMTAVPLALCTGFAEARGVGVTHQSRVQAQDARSVGRATNAPKAAPEMVSWAVGRATNYAPKTSPEMATLAGDVIVAERTPIQVSASEAASLLDDLRLQLAAQPAARLSIRWQLTRPVTIK